MTLRRLLLVLGTGVATLFAACSGNSMPPRAAIALAAHHFDAPSGSLLYVIDKSDRTRMSIFALPGGKKVVRKIHIPQRVFGDICSDRGGDVFVPGASAVLEYAHGGVTPIATLSASNVPIGCSSDPSSGDLAVAEPNSSQCSIAIYKNASGNPMVVTDSSLPYCQYPTYDNAGNLFFEGWTGSNSLLMELPAKRDAFRTVALNKPIDDFGFVQWDGHDLAIQARPSLRAPLEIYRVHVSGSSGTIVQTVHFLQWMKYEPWPWIQDNQVVDVTGAAQIGLWKYPQGGSPFKTFPAPEGIFAFAVSAPPSGGSF